MKQLQLIYKDDEALSRELWKLRRWAESGLSSCLLIQVFTDQLDRRKIDHVCDVISEILPEARVAGCSSNGNIVAGDYAGGELALLCTLFEYPTTQVEVFQYGITPDGLDEIAGDVLAEVEKRPWVKGIEILATLRGISTTRLCERLSHARPEIEIFGGGAISADFQVNDACVFSSAGGYAEKGAVIVLIGGEDIHIATSFVTGWKPLGSYLTVTAASGNRLVELNHRPAYEMYQKYLHIPNDENFFFNAREFPLFYHDHGIDIMRAPTFCNPDGSLTMSSDVKVGIQCRLAYGDPWMILETCKEESAKLIPFSPEGIFIFSCAGRRSFWGIEAVGEETVPYQAVAPTFGFYTSGEYLRTDGHLNQHNLTLVVAAMREGAPKPRPELEAALVAQPRERRISMVSRMATFIKVTTEELEAANRKLNELAVTDGLTGLGNKNAYFERIRALDARIASGGARFCVAIFDLNGLKEINDNYGHECGDAALTDTASLLKPIFGVNSLFRIGGDEFIAVLEGAELDGVTGQFEKLREKIAEVNRHERPYVLPLAIAMGASAFDPREDKGYQAVFRRADETMYRDKVAYYTTHDRRKR